MKLRLLDLVRQRNQYDCAVACVASALCTTYERVSHELPFDPSQPIIPEDNAPPGVDLGRYYVATDEIVLLINLLGHTAIKVTAKQSMLLGLDATSDPLHDRWSAALLIDGEGLAFTIEDMGVPAIVLVDRMEVGSIHALVYDPAIGMVIDLSPSTTASVDPAITLQERPAETYLTTNKVLEVVFVDPDLEKLRKTLNAYM